MNDDVDYILEQFVKAVDKIVEVFKKVIEMINDAINKFFQFLSRFFKLSTSINEKEIKKIRHRKRYQRFIMRYYNAC